MPNTDLDAYRQGQSSLTGNDALNEYRKKRKKELETKTPQQSAPKPISIPDPTNNPEVLQEALKRTQQVEELLKQDPSRAKLVEEYNSKSRLDQDNIKRDLQTTIDNNRRDFGDKEAAQKRDEALLKKFVIESAGKEKPSDLFSNVGGFGRDTVDTVTKSGAALGNLASEVLNVAAGHTADPYGAIDQMLKEGRIDKAQSIEMKNKQADADTTLVGETDQGLLDKALRLGGVLANTVGMAVPLRSLTRGLAKGIAGASAKTIFTEASKNALDNAVVSALSTFQNKGINTDLSETALSFVAGGTIGGALSLTGSAISSAIRGIVTKAKGGKQLTPEEVSILNNFAENPPVVETEAGKVVMQKAQDNLEAKLGRSLNEDELADLTVKAKVVDDKIKATQPVKATAPEPAVNLEVQPLRQQIPVKVVEDIPKVTEPTPQVSPKEEMVTLYHASPDMPKDGNWRKGTMFADSEQSARYYAESHHRGNIDVQQVTVPKSLVEKNKTNNIHTLKEEYPVAPQVSKTSLKTINGEASINDLYTKAKNSLVNDNTGVKPGSIERAKIEIENGTARPIKVKSNEDGSISIVNGRHRLQAAQELGIESYPIEDLSSQYGTKPIKTITQGATPPKPTGDTVSGNASRIEQNAIEKKLVDNFGDLPEYKAINMKEQAEEALDLISKNKQQAIDIIDGKANPPGNLKALSVHQALEEVATREGDVALLEKLARSDINTELSASAQNLRIAAERDPYSAVENIRQVRDARRKASERRSKTTVSKEVANIRKIVKAKTPVSTKQDWAGFIKELQCR